MLNIEECCTKNPRLFWEQINRLGPKKDNRVPWEVETDGNIITNEKSVMEKWRTDFEKLYKVDTTEFNDVFKANKLLEATSLAQLATINLDLSCCITYQEVSKAVGKSRENKSVGIDWIPNELFKHEKVIELLQKLFNACLEKSLIPDAWRASIVHLIPKTTRPSTDPLQYRGLALQCCIYKILSSILNERIMSHLETSEILADEQNGFRKDCSCLHHIFAINSLVRNKCRCKNSKKIAAFVDFRKAFDVTYRELMYVSMVVNRIQGKIMDLVKTLYTETLNIIRLNGQFSRPFKSEQGLRQGDNQSPTLFGLYISDLIKTLKNSKIGVKIYDSNRVDIINCLAYMNDLVILAETDSDMQILLNLLHDWCVKW